MCYDLRNPLLLRLSKSAIHPYFFFKEFNISEISKTQRGRNIISTYNLDSLTGRSCAEAKRLAHPYNSSLLLTGSKMTDENDIALAVNFL
jgi:hypothetical protein